MAMRRDSWYGIRRHGHQVVTGLGQEPDPDPENPGVDEPVLYLSRNGHTVCIMLKNLHFFCKYRDVVDGEFLLSSAAEYAKQLFPPDPNRWEVQALASIIENSLIDLLLAYPPELPTKAEIEAKMIAHGMKFSVGGKVIVDATS